MDRNIPSQVFQLENEWTNYTISRMMVVSTSLIYTQGIVSNYVNSTYIHYFHKNRLYVFVKLFISYIHSL